MKHIKGFMKKPVRGEYALLTSFSKILKAITLALNGIHLTRSPRVIRELRANCIERLPDKFASKSTFNQYIKNISCNLSIHFSSQGYEKHSRRTDQIISSACKANSFLISALVFVTLFMNIAYASNSVVEVTDRHFVIPAITVDSNVVRKMARKVMAPVKNETHIVKNGTPELLQKGALFAPKDDISKALQELIGYERHGIKVAMYMFTDPVLAQSLVAAYERGVAIEIVLDQSCIDGDYKAVSLLKTSGIPLFVYKSKKRGHSIAQLMHHKFWIFYANKGIGAQEHVPLVVTGSCNATHASKNHQENVVVVTNTQAISCYQNCFDELKAECVFIKKRGTALAKRKLVCIDGICA